MRIIFVFKNQSGIVGCLIGSQDSREGLDERRIAIMTPLGSNLSAPQIQFKKIYFYNATFN